MLREWGAAGVELRCTLASAYGDAPTADLLRLKRAFEAQMARIQADVSQSFDRRLRALFPEV
mgnify:CR=1 FL=1